jgi:hypothetical protein
MPSQPDHQQPGSIDLGCRLAAYLCGRVGSGQRCCWPLKPDPLGGVADTPLKKVAFVASLAIGFIAVADGLAMLLPGPSSKLGGAILLVLGVAWLLLGVPRLLSVSGRAFTVNVVARFGLLVLPPLSVPVAGLWMVATPSALSAWFAVAWFTVWAVCVGFSAFFPCPSCGEPFGRSGSRFQTTSSACPHCGANPRASAT